MAWFYYKMGKGRNNNLIHIPIAKIRQGYWDRDGLFRLTGSTLTIHKKDGPPKEIILENTGIMALKAGDLKKISDKYFGEEKICCIWWRGGFKPVGKKIIWAGKKKLHARQVTRFIGIVRKVWDDPSLHLD